MAQPESQLAARLLSCSPNTTVTEALLSLVDESSARLDTNKMAASLVRHHSPTGAAATAEAAARLHRSNRAHIRQLAILQLDADSDTSLAYVSESATRNIVSPRAAAAAATADPIALLELLRKNSTDRETTDSVWVSIGTSLVLNLVRRNDVELTRRVLEFGFSGVNEMVLKAVGNGTLNGDLLDMLTAATGYTLPVEEDLLEVPQLVHLPPREWLTHFQVLIACIPSMPDSLLKALLAVAALPLEPADWSRLVNAHSSAFTPAQLLTLATSGRPVLYLLALNGVEALASHGRADELPDELLHSLLEQASRPIHTVKLVAVPSLRARLSPEQLNTLLERHPLRYTHEKLARQILKESAPLLSSGAKVALLRRCHASVTSDWLTGRLKVEPTRVELEALVADPGTVLKNYDPDDPFTDDEMEDESSPRVSSRWLRSKTPPASIGDFVARFVDEFATEWNSDFTRAPAWAGWLLDEAGAGLVEFCSTSYSDTVCSDYLGYRLGEKFGSQRSAWLVVPTAASVFIEGTVTDFLSLVEALSQP